jgi:hypothetical protein
MPPPPVKGLHFHPSTKQPKLLPSIDRTPTQQLVYETAKDSSSSGFLFPGRKFRTSIRTLEVDEPSKDNAIAVLKFFS